MPLFDTHTHIYLSEQKTEKEIIENIQNNPELTYITSIAVDLETSVHNIELAKTYDFIIPTV
jgi:Tat protein secretion system quality control protein TatD with DNase activity